MNPDDNDNVPWGVLPEGISVGDRIEGMSCTDIRGRRTGTFVGLHPGSRSVVEITDDRDGSPSFVHAGSVKPLAGDLESAPVDPVSVPLPTPTPERDTLRQRMAKLSLEHRFPSSDVSAYAPSQIDFERVDAVMPVVDELRAEIEQLRAYAETTRYHQQKHAEAFRELTATRAERAQIVAALDGYQLVDGDCGQPSGTLVQHVAALREELATTRKELAKAKAAIRDIDAHATPMGLLNADDPDGSPHHYAVTVGALHRALGVGGTAPKCSQQYERAERLEKELATARAELAAVKMSAAWNVELASSTGRVAERFRVERDTARAELAELKRLANEVRKYWLDWPQSRRDGVRALSSYLHDAIAALAAGSSPVPEEPTPGEHVWDFDLTDPAKNRGVTSCSCGWETDQEETEQDGEILFNSHLVAAVRTRIAPSVLPEEAGQ